MLGKKTQDGFYSISCYCIYEFESRLFFQLVVYPRIYPIITLDEGP
jgi:hypothetical protein